MIAPGLIGVLAISIFSALCFASGSVLARAGLKNGSSLTALWISLLTNVVVLWSLSLSLYGFEPDFWQWRYFILAGLFAPLGGRMFRYFSIDRMGVNISSPLIQSHPFLAIGLAIVFLGEHLSLVDIMGGALAIFGSILVAAGGLNSEEEFQKKYLYLPLGSILCYAVSTIFRRIGIELGTPFITAGAVTVTASWLVLTLLAIVKPGIQVFQASRHGFFFFVMSGLATSAAVTFYYTALYYGNVVVVMPIMATQAVFTLMLSFIFLRRGYSEIFNPALLAGTLSVTAGVMLLGIFGLSPHH